MNPVYEKLVNCYNSVREKIDFVPDVALVLGSGLGDYGKEIKVVINDYASSGFGFFTFDELSTYHTYLVQ